jgi:hypothetical protein
VATYSDTTEQVFKRVLELLKPDLPASVLQIIQESIEKGTFQDIDDVLDAIEKASIGVDANGDR